METDMKAPVEQRHREAAADRLEGGRSAIHVEVAYTIQCIRDGKLDGHPWVQAFARFERDLTGQDGLADKLERLAKAATPSPWQGYSEPDVGLPYGLFAGTPIKSGFGPVEPRMANDIDLIVALRNNLPRILAALRASPPAGASVTPNAVVEALDRISVLASNHGGWFENEGFGLLTRIGTIANAALASNASDQAGDGA